MSNSILRRNRRSLGQSLLELAFIMPIMMLLMGGVLDFSRYVQTKQALSHLVRQTADIGKRQPVDAGSRTFAELLEIAVLNAEPYDLINEGRLYVGKYENRGTDAAPEWTTLSYGEIGTRTQYQPRIINRGGYGSTITMPEGINIAQERIVIIVEAYLDFKAVLPFVMDPILPNPGNLPPNGPRPVYELAFF